MVDITRNDDGTFTIPSGISIVKGRITDPEKRALFEAVAREQLGIN